MHVCALEEAAGQIEGLKKGMEAYLTRFHALWAKIVIY